MRVTILVGSSDRQSHSLGLGKAIQSNLESKGTDVTFLNLIETDIPLYDRALERSGEYPAAVRDFLELSEQTDAFVWVTPIYHNSYSALLKNALDWQHKMKFHGKVLGLASNGGDRSPQAVDQLMVVARSQGYVTVPKRVCTTESDYSDELTVVEGSILQRIDDFAEQLVDLSSRLR